MKYKIKITGFKTFGKKALATVANSRDLKLFNIFGFGLWIIRKERKK